MNSCSWFSSGIIHIAFLPGFLLFPCITTSLPLFTIEILPIDDETSLCQVNPDAILTFSASTDVMFTKFVLTPCVASAFNKSFLKFVTFVLVLDLVNTTSISGSGTIVKETLDAVKETVASIKTTIIIVTIDEIIPNSLFFI